VEAFVAALESDFVGTCREFVRQTRPEQFNPLLLDAIEDVLNAT
jgi:hypothetical protein